MLPGWCVHWQGIQHETCRAGVRHGDLKRQILEEERERFGLKYRSVLPCREADKAAANPCMKCKYPTPAELAAHWKAWAAIFEAHAQGVCPVCGTAMERQEDSHHVYLRCPVHPDQWSRAHKPRRGPERGE